MKNAPESMPQEFGPKNHELDPTQRVDFSQFTIGEHDITQLAGANGEPILPQLAEVFNTATESGEWTVDELGKLIAAIGPAKTLQDNIPAVGELLPGAGGKELAIEWVENSGLLAPVFRNFENPNELMPDFFDTAVITGGVRNWMVRRAQLLAELVESGQIKEFGETLLVAGNREMKIAEGPDVIEGDTEASFMERVIKPMLEEAHLDVRISKPDTANGEEIAQVVATEASDGTVLVVCNAGNWVQNGGQIRRAIGGDANRVYVVSDSFPVATNDEPPATHQNPLTAVGIIARNLQELQRHR